MPLVRLRRRVALLTAVAATAVLAGAAAAPAQGPAPLYRELHRPQFHFTPAQNWQNDPNGLVFYQGEYHMFYQYNPLGSVWGNISWGHAVSRDLVHWTELGVALPFTEQEAAWSGSVVVDSANTTGFGTPENPAMVAIYTIANPLAGFSQAQGLAYSLDRGRTWTKYSGNPVLDIDDPQFRDPKVFWHEPTRRWIMPVALSLQRKISIYSSPDLKAWTKESDFGPAGAITGVYEVPDLIPLTVTGRNATESKWALIVNVNPGARLGGSGAQYFIGDFDGKRFVADEEETYVAPAGDVLADFEAADHGGWTATGTAFGAGPAAGALAGQRPVVGFQGSGLLNSYADGPAAEGTLTSPEFTITRDHINFLVGGGDLPPLAGVAAEATVNLLVDGQTVRSATGDGSEWLDWAGWNVRDLRGRTARIQVVDRAGGARGFILLDQITQADELATSGTDRARWVDWGRDFYASITYDGEPSGRRLLVGWMNNWLYASTIPTSPWRGTQSAPRVLSLRRTGGDIELIQEPARELRRLRREPPQVVRRQVIDGTRTLEGDRARGKALDIEATLTRGTAERFGIKVLAGEGEETVIGYDAAARELYVDRTRSGNTSFSPRFASVSRAPLELPRSGRLDLRILVDHSSVEVFADRGRRVITDQVFPSAGSDRVRLFAEGGRASARTLKIWQMESIWHPDGPGDDG